ncbi:DNA damage-binding protein 1a [Apophysomyces ossiformis]|uniref:DNA damage-binding protein 1 n=1 Tax=Apophysomyces ossiformis TaxID=679940 RepID=A0A8H7BT91_9FUNG|nr:DNA damage-binding protein 1a [Apophysomyces ossiformis]
MSQYQYVVTAQKPTATQFAVKGNFTAVGETNLVLGKGTRIEIYTLTPDGLKPTMEFSIYGTIADLKLYKAQGRVKASLFVLTNRHKYCILSYCENTQQIVTEVSSEITMPGDARVKKEEVHSTVDPSCRYIATSLYESIVTIIIPEFGPKPRETGTYSRRSSLRRDSRRRQQQPPPDYVNIVLTDKAIVNMAFLQDATQPTLMILYEDALNRRYLQTFLLDLRHRELIGVDIVMDHFESEATQMIAMPSVVGGVILLGGKFIRYLKPHQAPKAIGIKKSMINSYTLTNDDGSRILLGDAEGRLYLLTLNLLNGTVDSLCFISLGQIPSPSCLSYLDNDVVFVGSAVGDSQLVYIHRNDQAAVEDGEILEVIEEFPNLGPVGDFCIADLDKQGQDQLITCSGAAKDSSLRIIRNGVGLNELAAIEISGVKGIWTLRPSFIEKHDHMLIISFINQTCLLQLRDTAMKRLDSYSGFALDKRTLAAANVVDDLVLQVTDSSVRLMDSRVEGCLLDEWFPDDQAQITVATINPSQCVVSIGYGRLIALQIVDRQLMKIGATQLEQEVSCIDITPIDPLMPLQSSVIAVGVWKDIGVRLLSLPSMKVIAQETLGGTVMPRSILMAKFEDVCYLLVALGKTSNESLACQSHGWVVYLGDGQFYNFKLDSRQGRLWDEKRSFLGKLPISLGTFTSNGTTHVFAASDKPSVIHSRNQKLIYSNVNLKEVRCVTSFNSLSFPDAIALTTKDCLVIGQMEEIQKLHITKIPTSDTPLRITYQESSRTFGITTETLISQSYSAQVVMGAFEILDDQTFSVLDRVYFKLFERPLAIATLKFNEDPNDYYVLGTGVESDHYESYSMGRILLFSVTEQRTLSIVSQIETDGMVEAVRSFQGKLLASIRGQLHLFRWDVELGDQGQLVFVCSHPLAASTDSWTIHNDVIVAGDIFYGLKAVGFNAQSESFEDLASEDNRKSVTAVEALNDKLFVAAEEEGHLFVVQRDDQQEISDEPLVKTVSQWHLGERIQRLRFGSLGMNQSDPDNRPIAQSLIFATASGAIGVIAPLSEDRFKLLWQMQNNMNKVIRSIGDLNHADWRKVSLMDRIDKCSNFIDGDLIESFLDLTPQQMQKVVDGHSGGRKLDSSVEDLCKVVEELMSIHS